MDKSDFKKESTFKLKMLYKRAQISLQRKCGSFCQKVDCVSQFSSTGKTHKLFSIRSFTCSKHKKNR